MTRNRPATMAVTTATGVFLALAVPVLEQVVRIVAFIGATTFALTALAVSHLVASP